MVFCSGKVFFDLMAARKERGVEGRRDRAHRAALSVPARRVPGADRASTRTRTRSSGARKSRRNQGAWHRIQHYLLRHMRAGPDARLRDARVVGFARGRLPVAAQRAAEGAGRRRLRAADRQSRDAGAGHGRREKEEHARSKSRSRSCPNRSPRRRCSPGTRSSARRSSATRT